MTGLGFDDKKYNDLSQPKHLLGCDYFFNSFEKKVEIFLIFISIMAVAGACFQDESSEFRWGKHRNQSVFWPVPRNGATLCTS